MKVGARQSCISFATNETRMKDELIFWEIGKNGFDDCWIEIVHDLFDRWGMCKIKMAVYESLCLFLNHISHMRTHKINQTNY